MSHVAFVIDASNLEKVAAITNGALGSRRNIGMMCVVYNQGTQNEAVATFKKKKFEKHFGPVRTDVTQWNVEE